jgi:hypothetical protein
MSGDISTTTDPTTDFAAVAPENSSIIEDVVDVTSTAGSWLRQGFSRAADGWDSFKEQNPNTAKIGGAFLALMGGWWLFNVTKNILSNPMGMLKTGLFAVGALMTVNVIGEMISNDKGFVDAVSDTIGDVGDVIGKVSDGAGDLLSNAVDSAGDILGPK